MITLKTKLLLAGLFSFALMCNPVNAYDDDFKGGGNFDESMMGDPSMDDDLGLNKGLGDESPADICSEMCEGDPVCNESCMKDQGNKPAPGAPVQQMNRPMVVPTPGAPAQIMNRPMVMQPDCSKQVTCCGQGNRPACIPGCPVPRVACQ